MSEGPRGPHRRRSGSDSGSCRPGFKQPQSRWGRQKSGLYPPVMRGSGVALGVDMMQPATQCGVLSRDETPADSGGPVVSVASSGQVRTCERER